MSQANKKIEVSIFQKLFNFKDYKKYVVEE